MKIISTETRYEERGSNYTWTRVSYTCVLLAYSLYRWSDPFWWGLALYTFLSSLRFARRRLVIDETGITLRLWPLTRRIAWNEVTRIAWRDKMTWFKGRGMVLYMKNPDKKPFELGEIHAAIPLAKKYTGLPVEDML